MNPDDRVGTENRSASWIPRQVAEQEQAQLLRADGLTMQDIAQRLGVSKSSVSLWVRDVDFVPRPRTRARRRGPNALQLRKQAEIDRLRAEGVARIGQLSEREFLVAGAALYAGEGNKGDGAVRVTNSDPRILGFFCAWLRHFYDIDEARLRVRLYLHDGLDIEHALAFWSDVTAVPCRSSGSHTALDLTSPSERRSTPTALPVSATVAPGHIEASWVWSGRCSAMQSFRSSSIGRAADC